VEFCNDGLTLSFNADGVPPDDGLEITIRPRNASNVVLVHYRVDGRGPNTVRASEVPDRWSSDEQIFRATFPALPSGATVEYLPVCQSVGRRVPPLSGRDLPASYRVPQVAPGSRVPREKTGPAALHPFSIEHLARFSVFVREPEIIGNTPDGIKVNWWVTSGSFEGPRLRGKLRPEGADWMTIRPDGIGILDVRATLETHDGALISVTYSGVFELGADGYRNFIAGKYPKLPEARTTPRYLTADPRYSWLNRLQCIAAGAVDLDTLNFVYDSFALR
jgi:uncharacterized protein DUF3237